MIKVNCNWSLVAIVTLMVFILRVNLVRPFSRIFKYENLVRITSVQGTRLFAKKRIADANSQDWITADLRSEKERKLSEMDQRVQSSKEWVSRTLSSEEAVVLNRALGIEKEMLSSVDEEDDEVVDRVAPGEKRSARRKEKVLKEPFAEEEYPSSGKMRGFLDINPYICSGCGTNFQSKSPEDPGFLPKEKFQSFQIQAKKIREKQEAIKILDLAGISLDSDTAQEVLSDANISADIIADIRRMGRISEGKADKFAGPKERSDEVEEPHPNSRPELANYVVRDHMGNLKTDKFFSDKFVDEIGLYHDFVPIDKAKLYPMQNPNKKMRAKLMSKGADAEQTTPSLKDESSLVLQQQQQQQQQQQYLPPPPSQVQEEDSNVLCICQRCFRLQQYGKVEESLRPGWSSHELLTPERFETLLSTIKDTTSVVLCLVDVFDLKGSILKNLKQIAGPNPIVIAVNKADLLPKDVSDNRIKGWVHASIKSYCGFKSPREVEEESRDFISSSASRSASVRRGDSRDSDLGILRLGNVHLVSCQKGTGIDNMVMSLMAMAKDNGNLIYVMGAANVGKSSFINRILGDKSKPGAKTKAGKVALATVSNLPGTTLDFIKIKLANGVTMIDTPGLLNPGQLTGRLDTEELKLVIPAKPINAVTLRVLEGKCVMMGGLASIELVEGRPFFFTFFVSNEIKLHPTDAIRVSEMIEKHIGTLVLPPLSKERMEALGPFEEKEFIIRGDSWQKASTDVVIAGLGWVSITGPGECRVRVRVPAGTSVGLREALLPFEASHSTAKFTGGKLMKRSRKPGTKSYGWRA